MRLIMFTLTVLLCSSVSIGQNLNNQAKLVEFLGQEKFDLIQSSNPNYLVYLDTRIESGYAVVDNADGKFDSATLLKFIPYRIDQGDGKDLSGECKNGVSKKSHSPEEFLALYQNNSLNILKYILKYDRSEVTYYLLGKTKKVLVLYPVEYINKLIVKKS